MEPVIRPILTHWYSKWWIWILVILAAIVILFAIRVVNELPRQTASLSSINRGFTPTTSFKRVSGTAPLISVSSPSLGSESALITIVEFADFSCPFSAQAETPLRKFLAAHPNSVRLVFRNFPLEDINPHARSAAIAAACANAQGLFWPYHDKLMTWQDLRSPDNYQQFAVEVGARLDDWQKCWDSLATNELVDNDQRAGIINGVIGTPTFFINGHRVTGVIPTSGWDEIWQRLGN